MKYIRAKAVKIISNVSTAEFCSTAMKYPCWSIELSIGFTLNGVDALTINRGEQNFTVFDQYGNLLYKYGTGGTEITVVSIETITIVPPLP